MVVWGGDGVREGFLMHGPPLPSLPAEFMDGGDLMARITAAAEAGGADGGRAVFPLRDRASVLDQVSARRWGGGGLS